MAELLVTALPDVWLRRTHRYGSVVFQRA